MTWRSKSASSIFSLLDVGFGSAATLVLSAVAARSLSLEGFGVYGIFFATAIALQSMVQGGYIDVYLRHARFDGALHWRIDKFFPIIAGVGLLSIGAMAFMNTSSLVLLLLTAISAVCLFVRFPWIRTSYYVRNMQGFSAVTSAILFISSFGFLLLNIALGWEGWSIVATSFVGSYTLSGIFSFTRAFLDRGMRSSEYVCMWRWDYALENALLVGSMQMSSVFVSPALGLHFNAGYRGGSMLFGPMSMFFSSARLLLAPYFAHKPKSYKPVVLSATSIAIFVLIWSVIVDVATAEFGRQLLGDSFEATQSLLFWFSLSYLSQGTYLICFLAGRAWLLDAAVRQGRLCQLIFMLLGVLGAIFYKSPELYFLGTIIGNIVAIAIVLLALKSYKKCWE